MVVEAEQQPRNNNQPRAHKIPVPTNYRSASKILRQVVEERQNVKTLVLQDKHFRKGKALAMMDLILVNLKQIDDILKRTGLLEKEPRLNPWLAKVLVAEMIFGRGELNGESLPVQCVLRYREALQEALGQSEVAPAKLLDFKEPRYVRVNTSVLALEGAIRLLQEEGWYQVEEEFENYGSFLERVKTLGDSEFLVDFHFKEVLVFPNSAKNYWARATELKQKFVLQNKACVLPTHLLNPAKKSVVLDMCAAPGLKTTHLANLMKNKGRIYAVERDPKRYKLLCDYVANFGAIKALNEDCLLIGDEQAPGVEYILLDPSCSGSGMVNRLKLNEEIDKQRLYKLGGLQYKLLCHAMNSFPSVKRIVYSTCSIYPEENEEIVQGALKHNGHFKLIDARERLDKEWINFGSPDYQGIGEKCLYTRPESDLMIGMFVAVFERCEEDEYNEIYLAHEKQKESYENLAKMGGFQKDKGRKRKRKTEEVNREDDEELNETTPEVFEEEMPIDEPTEKLKKKKKSKEIVHEMEELQPEDLNKIPENDEPTKKKKKKNSKDIEGEPIKALVEEPMPDGEPVKTKKKKKSKESDDQVEEVIPPSLIEKGDESNQQEKKKKKKKKVKSEDEDGVLQEATESQTVTVEPSSSVKKKRKSKHVD
ncbi:28S rRNA (cytosine-C(5))-methyltransferase [Uranotaenia lowii]|uniref:28S rRNA (cytosine-C(5))-methyltransferase n=1 Tax=Uranotaenia lowii TaxID=190385 RepID=UPI0024785CC8|nr:28S rRNA (cytosine-C(5))-methyltransferase [Uranotaenia lowii]